MQKSVQRLKIGVRASSTLAWYKNGRRKKKKVVYNFEHGTEPTYVPVGEIEA